MTGAGPQNESDFSIVPGQRDNKNAPLSLSEPSSRRFSIKRSLVISPGIKRRTTDTMARTELLPVGRRERRSALRVALVPNVAWFASTSFLSRCPRSCGKTLSQIRLTRIVEKRSEKVHLSQKITPIGDYNATNRTSGNNYWATLPSGKQIL